LIEGIDECSTKRYVNENKDRGYKKEKEQKNWIHT
jgi:hypothetical protein